MPRSGALFEYPNFPTMPQAPAGLPGGTQLPWWGGGTPGQIHPAGMMYPISGDATSRRPDLEARIFGNPAPAPASSPAIAHGVSDLPYLGQLAGGVNAINIGQQEQAIPGFTGNTAALTQEIHRLLNPNDPGANADVTLHGAENAFARGTVGSPLAGETTGRAREMDAERRAALGNQLLSGQASRAPAPFDVSKMMLTPAQFGQLDLEQQRLYLDWYKAVTGRSYPTGGGGGGGYGGGGGRVAGGGGVARPPMLDMPDSGGWGYAPGQSGEPGPDASMDAWAAYYAGLPYPQDPSATVPPYEGFDYAPSGGGEFDMASLYA